jgi:endo-alpha-1,4-polygalactosaminidase (GH114 family)
MTARSTVLAATLSLLPLLAACGGGAGGDDAGPGGATGASTRGAGGFRGDGSKTPSFGGWAWGSVPADAVAKAGFDWFETGYPGDTQANETLRNAGVRPFAYINLGELVPDMKAQSGYTGPILRQNGDWGTLLVDVTDQSWQDWLVRRADEAYRGGSRGIKWDVAEPDVPPGKTRADVNGVIAMVMWRVRQQHPDMKFIFNQGFSFALAHPEYVDALETEGLFSASSYPAAWLAPWNDPFFWGPQYAQAKQVHDRGIPVIVAEYEDPNSQRAKDLYGAITAQGFVPYITNVDWNIRGWGLNVPPGW